MDKIKKIHLVKMGGEYFKLYNKKFSIINMLLLSTVITATIMIADYYDSPSRVIDKIPNDVLLFVNLFFFVMVVLFILKFKIFEKIFSPLVNIFDFLLQCTIIGLFLFCFIILYDYPNRSQLVNYTVYILGLSLILLTIRIYTFGENTLDNESRIVDLKQIIEGKVSYDRMILVRENAVDYDLLNRGLLVNNLVRVINEYQSKERFVIGIEGTWGAGKTTYISNVLKAIREEENVIIIDDFEPWLSENKEALLNNLLNSLLGKNGLDIPNKDIGILVNSVSQSVFGKQYLAPMIKLIEYFSRDKEVAVLSDINYLINRDGKKVIFVIDNLDRLRPENAFMVLNIVNNVLNFNNLIIIMSYDADELGKGLQKINISPQYLEKIIQMKMVLPPTHDEDSAFIYYKTLISIFDKNRIEYDQSGIKDFSLILAKNQINLRKFKRFINSSVLPLIYSSRNLSIVDYLVIEFLHIYYIDIYKEVYLNKELFVSSDIGLERSLLYQNDKDFDDKLNKYFEKLNIKESIAGKLLQLSFPYVRNFFGAGSNYKNSVSTNRMDETYKKLQKEKRISSGKFFDLYFTTIFNSSSTIIDFVSNFVIQVNKNVSEDASIQENIDEILSKSPDMQTAILENLLLFEDEIETVTQSVLGKELTKNYSNFGDYFEFLTLDTKNRVAILIAQFLENLEFNEFKNFFEEYLSSDKYLKMVSNIYYWLEHSHTRPNTDKLELIDSKLDELVSDILSKQINIFESSTYERGSAFKILWQIEKKTKEDTKEDAIVEFKKYLNKSINQNTVYKILSELVTRSTGSLGYSYSMLDGFERYVDKELIEKYITPVEPKNDSQILLKKVFENHLIGQKDVYGDIAIHLNEPVSISGND